MKTKARSNRIADPRVITIKRMATDAAKTARKRRDLEIAVFRVLDEMALHLSEGHDVVVAGLGHFWTEARQLKRGREVRVKFRTATRLQRYIRNQDAKLEKPDGRRSP